MWAASVSQRIARSMWTRSSAILYYDKDKCKPFKVGARQPVKQWMRDASLLSGLCWLQTDDGHVLSFQVRMVPHYPWTMWY